MAEREVEAVPVIVRMSQRSVIGAKRLARQQGMSLNTYLDRLITVDLAVEAQRMRAQFAAEESALAADRAVRDGR